jgi:hypothetical protein
MLNTINLHYCTYRALAHRLSPGRRSCACATSWRARGAANPGNR